MERRFEIRRRTIKLRGTKAACSRRLPLQRRVRRHLSRLRETDFMIIEFTMKNTRPLADKTPITCCGDFRDEKHWEAFKRVEALRGWRVHESEKVNLVETPNDKRDGRL